jgi:hypothetical protein
MGKFTFTPQYDEPDVPWDKSDPASVKYAQRCFDSYIERKGKVFEVGPKGEMTEVHTFNPDCETLFVFYFGGGC